MPFLPFVANISRPLGGQHQPCSLPSGGCCFPTFPFTFWGPCFKISLWGLPGFTHLCPAVSFFLSNILKLRYNSHTIKVTILNCPIHLFIVCSQGCAAITAVLVPEHSHHPQNKTPCPLLVSLHPPSPAPDNHRCTLCRFACSRFFFLIFKNYFYFILLLLFLVALGLRCCAWAFPSCGEQGLLFVAVRGLLIAVASLVVAHRH